MEFILRGNGHASRPLRQAQPHVQPRQWIKHLIHNAYVALWRLVEPKGPHHECMYHTFSLHFVRPSHNSPIGSGIFCSSPEQNVNLTTSVSGPNPLSKRLPFLLFATTRLSGTTFCTDIRTTNDIDETKVMDRIEG